MSLGRILALNCNVDWCYWLFVYGCKFWTLFGTNGQWGIFNLPHVLWHGASVTDGHLRGSVTLTAVAKRLSRGTLTTWFYNLGLSRLGFEYPAVGAGRLRSELNVSIITSFRCCVMYWYNIYPMYVKFQNFNKGNKKQCWRAYPIKILSDLVFTVWWFHFVYGKCCANDDSKNISDSQTNENFLFRKKSQMSLICLLVHSGKSSTVFDINRYLEKIYCQIYFVVWRKKIIFRMLCMHVVVVWKIKISCVWTCNMTILWFYSKTAKLKSGTKIF